MSKPEVVLLHGWGMHAQVWGEFATHLAAFCQVHSVDLPGYGGSLPCEPYDLDTLAAQVADNLPQRALVLGWSMGGLVAQRLALRMPQRVEKLILMAGTPCFSGRADWRHGMADKVLDAFQAQLRGDALTTLRRFLAVQSMGGEDAKAQTQQLRQAVEARPLPSVSTLAAGLDILRNSDLRADVAQIHQPCCLIHGEADTVVPLGAAQYLHAHLAHSQLHTLAGCAHAPFLSRPAECAAVLRDFVRDAL